MRSFAAHLALTAALFWDLGPVVRAAPSDLVNNFIGTINGGHVFAGATLPFGSVKAVADSDSSDNQGGFVSDGSPIRGISQLHDDGTGGGASLGQFKLLPMYCSTLSACKTYESERTVGYVGSPKASPGYFSIDLASKITAEVSVTSHAAIHRFTYSNLTAASAHRRSRRAQNVKLGHHDEHEVRHDAHAARAPVAASLSPVVLLDLTNDLGHSWDGGSMSIQPASSGTLRVTGGGQFTPSFGLGRFKVYFCADIPNVVSVGYYSGRTFTSVNKSTTVNVPSSTREAGILAQLSTSAVLGANKQALARVGVSWTSTTKACQFADREIAPGSDSLFDRVRNAAKAKWDSTLGTVGIDATGASTDVQVNFWTSLYRAYISPTNITGDNPLYSSTEPYYDSLYCIWDSFRVVHPLYAITQRTVQAEVVRALIDIYRNLGFLPDCRMSLDKGYTQGGSNADSLLGDSYAKGISAGINWSDGLKAMIKDATVTPPDWNVEGRGGIPNRAKVHYVPFDDDTPGGTKGRSASRTLEYAFNDFDIALVAHGLGDKASETKYLNASGDWKNLWNPATTSSGYKGFIQPRYLNGKWYDVDPTRCSPVNCHTCCYLNDQGGEFYEASSWEYSYYAPHDMATVVKLMGGKDTYNKRLDAFFSQGYHDIGDEPGFLPTFLYNYGGRPDKTVDRVLGILKTYFNTTTGGIPGNDDSGATGGYVVFASFGFYPVAGTSVYLISTPLFKSITFPASDPSKKAVLTTVNFDGGKTNKYVVSAKLNGASITRNWFSHKEFFGNGGTLELTLGSKPSSWGTADADLPPSISTGTIDAFL